MQKYVLAALLISGCAVFDPPPDGVTPAEGDAARTKLKIASYDISHEGGDLSIVALARDGEKIATLRVTYPVTGEIDTEAITLSGKYRAITIDVADVRFTHEADYMLPVLLPISDVNVYALVSDPVVKHELDGVQITFQPRLLGGEIAYGDGYWSACESGDNFKGSPYGFNNGNCSYTTHGSGQCQEQGSYFDGYCNLYGMPWDEQNFSRTHCNNASQCGGQGDLAGWRICGPFPQNTCSPCGYVGPEGCIPCGQLTATCGQ